MQKWIFFLAKCLASWALMGPVSGVFAADEVAQAIQAPDYRVSRGDELNLRFFHTPELNTVATVRSDGRIALPLIGELKVEGQTVAELSALIERLLAPQVRRPQVAINVQGLASQRIFVGGEVGRPGVQPLLGPLTALQAVMVAEGLKDSAQPRRVVVLRRGPRDERTVLTVDLDSVMNGREGARDVALQAHDVVIVPRSGIADLNLWVEQYIRRVLPFSMGFSYTVNKGGTIQ